MEEKQPLHTVADFRKGFVTFPMDGEAFKDFIVNLLGVPQKITKRFKGNYTIYLKDLQNFHHLLDQRITQQNAGKLIQLKTTIYFTDQSSVTLNSYSDLVSYNEVKPIVSEAVQMTWTYLIQFADKKTPEKQQIEIMIICIPLRNVIETDGMPEFLSGKGEIRIGIDHTARSWGSDIESLLTHQIKSMTHSASKLQEYINKKSSAIGIFFALIFLLSSIAGIFVQTERFVQSEVIRVNEVSKTKHEVEAKVDFLLAYIASNSQNFQAIKSQVFFIISLIVSVVLGVWISAVADNRPNSYLILTSESVKMMDSLEEKRKRKGFWFCMSIIVSVLAGILDNLIFSWIYGA